jgi:GT2 family glycosyltransferase
MTPDATIVIPVYNGARFLAACLGALRNQQGATCRVVAVDNASTDGSAELIATRFPDVTLLRNSRNQGFSRGVNRGIAWELGISDWRSGIGPQDHVLVTNPKSPDVVVLLNQDTIVAPDWLRNLLEPFADPTVGAVGCKIYDHDGRTLQHAGGAIDYPRATTRHLGLDELDQGQYDAPGPMAYVTGAALGLRVAALRKVGLLDERFSPAYMEEVDLCWRLHAAGWQVWYNPAAQVRHFEHGSPLSIIPRLTLLHRNRLRFVFKHYRAEQILDDFWPAERRALWRAVGTFDEAALLRAYLDALLLFDTFAAARADMALPPLHAAERRALAVMLRELRDDLVRLRSAKQIDVYV